MKRLTSLILATTLSISLFNVATVEVSARGNDVNIDLEENYEIYPLPQNEIYSGSDFRITDEVNIVVEDGIDEYTRNFIVEILDAIGINNIFSNEMDENKTNIIIGVRGSHGYVDNYFSENIDYNQEIFSEEDAYVLKIDNSLKENGVIAILGETTDSAYYGLATLKIIFNQIENNQIKNVMYEDFADAKWRGFIEGFYGYPWSNEDRKSLMEFGGNFKMNSYIFAPKDDPYHNRQWRELYPEDKLAEIKELVDVGNKSKTKFIWAIHPGFNMINWNDYHNELQTLLNKLEQLYSIGVRQFGLFMDDISTDQSLVDKDWHVKLVTDVANWINEKGDCYSLVYCPPYYNQAWTGEKGKPYLRALANVPENVEIMWTGVDVCGQVVESEMQWPKDLIGRDTYMWLNWPVNGHNSARLMLGKGEVLNPGVHNISGIVTNPLEYAELSKTAIFAIADYTWNTDEFNDDKSWSDSFKYINPEVAEEFHIIASHLSDPSPSNRNLVLEESEYIKEDLELFLNNYNNDEDISEVGSKLIYEFDKILDAIIVFNSEKNLNEKMKSEIKPWLGSLEYIVKACKASVNSAIAIRESNLDLAWRELSNATVFKETSKTFTTKKLNSPDVVVESGAKRLIPFANELISSLDSKIYMEMDPQASSRIPMASYNSNELDLMVDGDEETYAYFKSLQKVGDWYGVDLGKVIEVNNIEILQGRNDTDHDRFHKGILEYSEDGENWLPIGEERTDYRIVENNLSIKARYIRYRATTAGVPGGKPDLWTAVREIRINKEENKATLFTNVKELENIKVNISDLKTEILDVSNITLKTNEYLGFKLTGIERIAEIICEMSSEKLNIETSINGVEWNKGTDVSEARYIRVINKENNDIKFDLNKLSVTLNKFQDTKITHNFGSIYSGSIENIFDKKLESKVWFGSPQGKDKYVQVDLGGVIDIDKIDLIIGDSEKDYFRNGNLEISLDGEEWEAIDEITGGSREANFPILKAPYRYRTIDNINKKARYIRLISKNNSNAWLALNEILINEGINIDTNTNLEIIAKPEGELSNTSSTVIDKKLSTFYTPAGEALEGELLYRISDYSEVSELIILQGPTGISNANVEIRDLDGWHEIGTLSNSYNYFDTSKFNNVLDIKLVWDVAKPIINEIITVKKISEDIPDDIIDKEKLKEIIESAKSIVENEADKYTKETIDALKEAINIAEEVWDNDQATQEQIEVAKIALEVAISQLEENDDKPTNVNKEALKITIDYANELKESGALEGVVPAVVKLFDKTLAEAYIVYNNEFATQAEVDGEFNNLAEVIHMLEFKKGDKSELENLINSANALDRNDYTEESWFKLEYELQEASKVLSDENAMQDEINEMSERLKEAIKNLEEAKKVDKSALQDLINRVKETDSSKYIESTWISFENALKNATEILESETSTQVEVNEVYNSLLRAYLSLRLTPDKSLLEGLIKEVEGLDLSKYTTKSVNLMKKELAKARVVLNNKEATEDEVNEAVENLRNAKESLVAKSDVSNNKDSESNFTSSENKNDSNLPKTGNVISSEVILIIASILAFGGILILKKKSELK